MANFEEFAQRWLDRFWERFAKLTGWDPDPQIQLTILAAAFGAIFLAFLLLYVRRIMKNSTRAARRDKVVANYQTLRRYRSADDR